MIGTLVGATTYTALSFFSTLAYKTTVYITSKTVTAIDYAIIQTLQHQVQSRLTQGIEHIGHPQPQEIESVEPIQNSPKRKTE